jgi:hypothetical protein
VAIAHRATGIVGQGTASFVLTVPALQVTGDMMFAVAWAKPFDGAWSMPGGWTSLGRGQSGTTAAGADTGSVVIEVWYKEATSDTEANPTLTEGTPAWNVAQGCIIVFSKGAGETWATPVIRYAADETSGTALSFTFASDPGGAAGDYVLMVAGINTDAMGPLTADLAPTWTGITFGTADAASEFETTSGGDIAGHLISRPVSSGTSSAAPSMTGTGTASGGADRAEGAFIRMRVTASADADGEVSWAEFEVPNANSDAEVSWAELEVPNADARADISWAEFEVPNADARADISWTELEVPDLAADADGEISWVELSVPDAPLDANGEVSWAELEIPNADANAEVSWAEFEVPTADSRADISWAEFEVPNADAAAEISWAALEIPETVPVDADGEVSYAEFEVPTADATGQVSWAELEVPDGPADADGEVSYAEFEVPSVGGGPLTDLAWVIAWQLALQGCDNKNHLHYPRYPDLSDEDSRIYEPVRD